MDLDYELQREAFLLCHLGGGRYEELDHDDKKKFLMLAEQQVSRQRKLKELRKAGLDAGTPNGP